MKGGPRARRGAARLVLLLSAVTALALLAWSLFFLGAGRSASGVALEESESGLTPAETPLELAATSGLEERSSQRAERRVEAASEAPALAELAPAVEPRSWTGTVRSRSSRELLADVGLVLRDGTLTSGARTDGDGRFELSWSGASTPTLEAACEGYVTLRLAAVDLDRPAQLELTPGAELRVALRGPGRSELEDVEASLWDLALDRRARGRGDKVRADDQGVFHFRELAAGEYSVGVHVPGWSLAYEHRVLLEAGERVDLTLEPARGAMLRGVVRWVGDGAPVVGAAVRFLPDLSGTSSSVESLARLETATDVAGRFSLGGLSTGRGKLRVETEDGAWRDQEVFLEEAGTLLEVEVELARPGSLAGQVVDPRGQGVGGVRLAVAWQNPGVAGLREPDPEGRALTTVACDVNGRFLVTGLPARRPLHLGASELEGEEVSAFRTLRVPALESGEEREGIELVLLDTLRIRGEVRDELGAPIASARVRASRLSQGGAARFDEVRSAADGSFELTGLLPGRYRVDARDARDTAPSEQHLGSAEEVELEPDRPPAEVVLELEKSLSLEGWVVDEWGVAVRDARIRARSLLSSSEGGGRDLSARSDEFGRFEVGRMSAGDYALSASATGYEPSAEEVFVSVPGHDSARLELRRREPVERVVLRGSARLEDGSAPIALGLADTRGGSFSQAGTSFRVTGVRPGRARLELRARDQIPIRLEPLDLLPGSEVDLGEVRFERAGSVRVEVRDPQGAPLVGFKARLAPLSVAEGGSGGRAISLERERVRRQPGQSGPLPQVASSSRVPLKKWRLVVERKGYQTHRQVIGLDAGRTSRRLVVTLERR